jgi:BirA family transcriptional regulator, biotin operon repressor / biotin---[acetyl-CoA-carboxylase] ligase
MDRNPLNPMDTTLDQIRAALQPVPMGGLRYFDEIGSTNDEAMTWGSSGAPDFSLVVADTQTAGRGRLARKWVTRPNAALAFSLILHPTPAEMEKLTFFSPWGALAVCEALEAMGLPAGKAEIKWPNDVLLERRKVAGILLESSWVGEKLQAAVVGIGINIAATSVPPAAEVQYPADSVEGVFGHPVDRWDLLANILTRMQAWRTKLASQPFLDAWESRLAFRNEWVHVGDGISSAQQNPGQIGRVEGLDPNGQLRLRDADGETFSIHVGEISLRPT